MNVLQLAGGLAVAKLLFDQVATQVANQVNYEVLPVRRQDFRASFNFKENQFVGILKVRLKVSNNLPVDLTAQSLQLRISQEGSRIGTISTNNPIVLPSGVEKQLAVEMHITASDFLERVLELTKGGAALAPVHVNGVLSFSNGDALPISRTLQFFTVT